MAAQANKASEKDWSVFSAPVNAIVLAAEQFGVSRKELLSAAGIAAESFAAPDNRIDTEHYFRLARAAETLSKNPDIALYAGRISFLHGLNLQLYMATICHTFRDYLNLMPSVLKLWGDIGEVKVRPEGDFIRLEWRPLASETGKERFLSDTMLSASAAIVDSLCLLPVPVRRACFSYDRPKDTKGLTEVFGKDLSFSEPVSCLYFDRASLDYKLVEQNYRAAPGAIPFADLFDGKDPSDKFWSRLRQSIVGRLPDGDLKQEDVAADLNMSVRSLQRQLNERGSAFRTEVKTIRAHLAARYLSGVNSNVTQVAFLLGYSDQSAFSSAFRKWYRMSPSEYQRQHNDGG